MSLLCRLPPECSVVIGMPTEIRHGPQVASHYANLLAVLQMIAQMLHGMLVIPHDVCLLSASCKSAAHNAFFNMLGTRMMTYNCNNVRMHVILIQIPTDVLV